MQQPQKYRENYDVRRIIASAGVARPGRVSAVEIDRPPGDDPPASGPVIPFLH